MWLSEDVAAGHSGHPLLHLAANLHRVLTISLLWRLRQPWQQQPQQLQPSLLQQPTSLLHLLVGTLPEV